MRSATFAALAIPFALLMAAAAPPAGGIVGQAFIQTSSGAPRTCAGQDDIVLVPANNEASVEALFGPGERGFVEVGAEAYVPPTDARTASCDATGGFKFSGLTPGDYYLISRITWSGGKYGGQLMRRVTVSSGAPTDIILSTSVEDLPPSPPPPPPRDKREIAIEAAVKGRLFDPGSAQIEWSGRWINNAQYKQWKWSKPIAGDMTCGHLNARNRMGGYVGRVTFLAIVQDGRVVLLLIDDNGQYALRQAEMQCRNGRFF